MLKFMNLLFFALTPTAVYSGTGICVAKWWARLEKLLGSKEMEGVFLVGLGFFGFGFFAFFVGGGDVTAQSGAARMTKEQSAAGPALW